MSAQTAEQVLQRLLAGNARYRDGHATHPNQTRQTRESLEGGQHPIAAIVACSDSRVPPSLIFDQGLGDLFVIRVAGNIVGEVTLASVEYAVAALRVPLVLVLGHSGCGAVTAALEGHALPGHLPYLAGYIAEAVQIARRESKAAQAGGDVLTNAINANARIAARDLQKESHLIQDAVITGRVQVRAAYYDMHDGAVTLLESDL